MRVTNVSFALVSFSKVSNRSFSIASQRAIFSWQDVITEDRPSVAMGTVTSAGLAKDRKTFRPTATRMAATALSNVPSRG